MPRFKRAKDSYKKTRSYTATDLEQEEIISRIGMKTEDGRILSSMSAVILYGVKQLPHKK